MASPKPPSHSGLKERLEYLREQLNLLRIYRASDSPVPRYFDQSLPLDTPCLKEPARLAVGLESPVHFLRVGLGTSETLETRPFSRRLPFGILQSLAYILPPVLLGFVCLKAIRHRGRFSHPSTEAQADG